LKLALHEWGDRSRPTIVCVHGVTSQGLRFAPLAVEGLGRSFHLVAPDLRGHGDSGWEPPWSLEQHLEDLLESVPPDARLWVGHSFGGRLVLELAARNPERVERAVLLDPAIRVRPDNALAAADEARRERTFRTREEATPPMVEGRLLHTPAELLEENREQHLEPVDGGFRWRYSQSAVVALLGELAAWGPPPEALQAPVLLVLGSDETVVGPRQLDRYRRALGDRLQVVNVPGGHVVLWDAFAETADAVTAFLGAA